LTFLGDFHQNDGFDEAFRSNSRRRLQNRQAGETAEGRKSWREAGGDPEEADTAPADTPTS